MLIKVKGQQIDVSNIDYAKKKTTLTFINDKVTTKVVVMFKSGTSTDLLCSDETDADIVLKSLQLISSLTENDLYLLVAAAYKFKVNNNSVEDIFEKDFVDDFRIILNVISVYDVVSDHDTKEQVLEILRKRNGEK